MCARRETASDQRDVRFARGWALSTVQWLLALALLLAPTAAAADTVYLKNGRVLRAAKVTVTDDRVILEQSGNRVELPRDLVERIERDGEASEVLEPREERSAPARTTRETDEGDADGGDAEGSAPETENEGPEAPEDPKQTREYWQDIMRVLEEARGELREALEELHREERAFLFSHRSTAEVKAEIARVEAELAGLDEREQELRREARRLQVPPGWLRLGG